MRLVGRFIIVILIIFFAFITIYSVAGVVATYFIAPEEFGNTLKDAGSTLFATGDDTVWLLILTVGWSIGWFVYSWYRRKNNLSKDTVSIHTFIALTFFLSLVSASEILSLRNGSVGYQVLVSIIQSIFYIAIGIALIMRKKMAVYLYVLLVFVQLAIYSTILKPTIFPQITLGFVVFGSVAFFLLFRRNWNQLH